MKPYSTKGGPETKLLVPFPLIGFVTTSNSPSGDYVSHWVFHVVSTLNKPPKGTKQNKSYLSFMTGDVTKNKWVFEGWAVYQGFHHTDFKEVGEGANRMERAIRSYSLPKVFRVRNENVDYNIEICFNNQKKKGVRISLETRRPRQVHVLFVRTRTQDGVFEGSKFFLSIPY